MNLLRAARATLRTKLWPLPTLALLVAVSAGFLLPGLDRMLDSTLPTDVERILFGGDAGAARSLLGAIASSLITVTSLTFSLTVVTLQLASSQFSPRLLRTFTRDLFVQLTLALFLATFIYALTVMRSVRGADGGGGGGGEEFVPRLAVTVAFFLAVVSVLGLVLFLAHLTEQIRVETMLRNVHEDATATMRSVLPERDAAIGREVDLVGRQRPDDLDLPSNSSGFFTWVEERTLVEAARRADAVVVVTAHPGSSLVAGVPVGYARFANGRQAVDDEVVTGLLEEVAGAVHTGFERTESQDVSYGLRQLTDVTNKALSPGINDPTTAVHALGHLSALLCDLSDRQLGAAVLHDADDRTRVVLCRPDLGDLVEVAIGQPRRYGASDHQVMTRLFLLLAELAFRVSPDQHPVVHRQLDRLRTTAAAEDYDETERAALAELGGRVEWILANGPGATQGTTS